MRNLRQMFALTAVFAATLLATSTLYARDDHGSSGSTITGGMMGGSRMMSQMMSGCSSMMQSGSRGNRPNDQWRKKALATQEKES